MYSLLKDSKNNTMERLVMAKTYIQGEHLTMGNDLLVKGSA
jgi:hypothetical protein